MRLARFITLFVLTLGLANAFSGGGSGGGSSSGAYIPLVGTDLTVTYNNLIFAPNSSFGSGLYLNTTSNQRVGIYIQKIDESTGLATFQGTSAQTKFQMSSISLASDGTAIYNDGSSFNGTPGGIYIRSGYGIQANKYKGPIKIEGGQVTIVANTQLEVVGTVSANAVSCNSLTVGTSNNTSFESTGFMIATGSAVAYDDVAYASIASQRSTGVGSLTLTTITGNIQGFAFAINDYVNISAEFTHSWKIGTPISIHCHVVNKSTNAANRFFKMQFEYSFADINGGFSTPVVISNNFTVPANDPINKAYYVEIGTVTPPSSLVSAHIVGLLSRVTATGTAVGADPIVLSFGCHGQVDSLGSRSEYVK